MTTFNTQEGFSNVSIESVDETYFSLINGFNSIGAEMYPLVRLSFFYKNNSLFDNDLTITISNGVDSAVYNVLNGTPIAINLFVDDNEVILDTLVEISSPSGYSTFFTITSANYTETRNVVMYRDTLRQDSRAISSAVYNRSIGQAELIQLYNNSNIANPLLHNPYKTDGLSLNSQQSLVLYHLLNQDLIYNDGGTIKVRNLADDSGTTDGILNGLTNLEAAHEALFDFRELRLSTEIL